MKNTLIILTLLTAWLTTNAAIAANDPIELQTTTGLTLSAKFYSTAGLVDTIAMTESPAGSGRYIITDATLVTEVLPEGTYGVRAEDAGGTPYGADEIRWSGTTRLRPLVPTVADRTLNLLATGEAAADVTHSNGLPIDTDVPRTLLVDTTATGDSDGSGWTDAFPTLQGAINAAEPGDRIVCRDGQTHVANLTISEPITIQGVITIDPATGDAITVSSSGVRLIGITSTDPVVVGVVDAPIIERCNFSNYTETSATAPAALVYSDINGTYYQTGVDVSAVKTKTDFLPSATAGAAGGVFIAGTNAATTISSSTGNALTLISTGNDGHGLSVTGNATGSGIYALGGDSSGSGIFAEANSGGPGNGTALRLLGRGAGHGLSADGGASGNDIDFGTTATAPDFLSLLGLASGNLDVQLGDIPKVLSNGTAQAGAATTIQLASAETYGDDDPVGYSIKIISGTGAGQARPISDYVGATDTATVSTAWDVTPDNTSVYEIVESSSVVTSISSAALAEVNNEVATALAAINLDHLLKNPVDTSFDTTVNTNSAFGYLTHNGAGGAYDRNSDSLEAVRDRGDLGWATATGFSTHSVSDIWNSGSRTLTSSDSGVLPIASGTAQSGTTSSIVIAASTSLPDDQLNGYQIQITSGTGAGQAATITDFVGSTDTVSATFAIAPDNSSVYQVVPIQLSASDVWAAATRTLSAGTNIVLAKGTGVTGFNDLDAAGIRTAVGLAAANLDTQFGDIPTADENAVGLLGKARVGAPTAGSYGELLEWMHGSFASDGVFATAALANSPASSGDWTADQKTAIQSILGFSTGPGVLDPGSGILDEIRDDTSALITGSIPARDLLPVQFVWRLKPSGENALRSISPLVLSPGTDGIDDYRAGFNCKISTILPGGLILAEMGTPTSSDPTQITVAKTTAAPGSSFDATIAKLLIDVIPSATPGTYWISVPVTNSAGDGPVTVYGEVTIQAAP